MADGWGLCIWRDASGIDRVRICLHHCVEYNAQSERVICQLDGTQDSASQSNSRCAPRAHLFRFFCDLMLTALAPAVPLIGCI